MAQHRHMLAGNLSKADEALVLTAVLSRFHDCVACRHLSWQFSQASQLQKAARPSSRQQHHTGFRPSLHRLAPGIHG